MRINLGLLAATAALVMAGCTPQARDEYKSASNDAAQAIKTDAKTSAHALRAMGDSAKQSIAKDTAEAKDKADSTPSKNGDKASQIDTALKNSSGIDTSHLTVTQSGSKIVLDGTVPSAHQKNQVRSLASSMCGTDYTLVDKLQTNKG